VRASLSPKVDKGVTVGGPLCAELLALSGCNRMNDRIDEGSFLVYPLCERPLRNVLFSAPAIRSLLDVCIRLPVGDQECAGCAELASPWGYSRGNLTVVHIPHPIVVAVPRCISVQKGETGITAKDVPRKHTGGER